MHRLKTFSRNLREVFEQSISARYLAESIVSFDHDQPVASVRQIMESRDFDQVGVRENGVIVGFAHRSELAGGVLGHHLVRFVNEDPRIIAGETCMLDALRSIRQHGVVFVTAFGQVAGIATRGDVQKAPVRMWLFGLISIFEMQVLRLIRGKYPEDAWTEFLKEKRVTGAKAVLEERQTRHSAIDLADCLQIADKREIILKSPELLGALGIGSKTTTRRVFIQIERLRNDLAHAQNISTHWPDFLDLADIMDHAVSRMEPLSRVDLQALGQQEG